MLSGVTLTKCYTCTRFYLYIYETGLSPVYRSTKFMCQIFAMCQY